MRKVSVSSPHVLVEFRFQNVSNKIHECQLLKLVVTCHENNVSGNAHKNMIFKPQSKTNCSLKAWSRMGEILKLMFVNKLRQCQLAEN